MSELTVQIARVLVIAIMAALSGCAAVQLSKGAPNRVDLSPVHAGASRSAAESSLGEAQREWVTSHNVRYVLYAYYAGVPPQKGLAAGIAALDILLFGIPEIVCTVAADKNGQCLGKEPHEVRYVAVSYSAQDVAMGVFLNVGPMESLPDDGIPTN